MEQTYSARERAIRKLKTLIQKEKDKYYKLTSREQKAYSTLKERSEKTVASAVEMFSNVTENHPCKGCGSCCSSVSGAGHFKKGDFHPDIITDKVNLLSYLGPEKKFQIRHPDGTVTETSNACIFYTDTGCGIPHKYRSATCVGYYCVSLGKAIGRSSGGAFESFNNWPGTSLVANRNAGNKLLKLTKKRA